MLTLVEIALSLFGLIVFYIIILSGILSACLYFTTLGSYISILVVFKTSPYLVGAIVFFGSLIGTIPIEDLRIDCGVRAQYSLKFQHQRYISLFLLQKLQLPLLNNLIITKCPMVLQLKLSNYSLLIYIGNRPYRYAVYYYSIYRFYYLRAPSQYLFLLIPVSTQVIYLRQYLGKYKNVPRSKDF